MKPHTHSSGLNREHQVHQQSTSSSCHLFPLLLLRLAKGLCPLPVNLVFSIYPLHSSFFSHLPSLSEGFSLSPVSDNTWYCLFLFALITANSQIIPQTCAGCLAKAAQNEMFLYVRGGQKCPLIYSGTHVYLGNRFKPGRQVHALSG